MIAIRKGSKQQPRSTAWLALGKVDVGIAVVVGLEELEGNEVDGN